jgi:hypothetical protein
MPFFGKDHAPPTAAAAQHLSKSFRAVDSRSLRAMRIAPPDCRFHPRQRVFALIHELARSLIALAWGGRRGRVGALIAWA